MDFNDVELKPPVELCSEGKMKSYLVFFSFYLELQNSKW